MISKIISYIRRKIFRLDKYRWDHQYSRGQWDSLRTDEMQRLLVAKELLNKYAVRGNILEIGCGEGVFFHQVSDLDFNFYEGIDLSEVAISRIEKAEKTLFRSANMETYLPANYPFSVIVLNEVLYYSKNPIALLKKYCSYLTTDGTLLIGMHETAKSAEIWADLEEHFSMLDSVKVQQESKAWHYKTFRSL